MDEVIRLLGEDVSARRYGVRNTIDFYAELLARHGRIEELHALACTHPSAARHPLCDGLGERGSGEEAEAHLRGLIASGHPGWHESMLMGLLFRQGRFDEGVEAVERTFDDLYDGNLLQAAMLPLAEHGGRYDRAIELTEGRSPEFLAENDEYWLRDNRWRLTGESGDAREAIAEVEALPPGEPEDRELTVAWLLAQDGRTEDAIALVRSLPGTRTATDLAELLIRRTIAEVRSTSSRAPSSFSTARRSRRHRPASVRTVKRRCAAAGDVPEVGGKCRQAQPLVSAYTTAVNTARSSHGAVPPPGGRAANDGSNGAASSHSSSGTDASIDQHPRPAACRTNIASRETTSKP
ncbi:hypothetical protein JCM4914_01370 [Streptomyces platensis subsp. malvinus]